MRGRFETVVLAGIYHQFGFAAQTLQSLVHLLAPEDGHIPVDVSAHEQSWRGDIRDSVIGRDFLPHGAVLPRVAEFHIVVEDVLVMSVKRCEERRART